MSEYAETVLRERARELLDIVDEQTDDAARLRERADKQERLAHANKLRATDLIASADLVAAHRDAVPDESAQWTKDELARLHAEGHAAIEPNALVALRLPDDWSTATPEQAQEARRPLVRPGSLCAGDPRDYQPDGDTYGHDFPEPHLG
jgi:hypothetical protein